MPPGIARTFWSIGRIVPPSRRGVPPGSGGGPVPGSAARGVPAADRVPTARPTSARGRPGARGPPRVGPSSAAGPTSRLVSPRIWWTDRTRFEAHYARARGPRQSARTTRDVGGHAAVHRIHHGLGRGASDRSTSPPDRRPRARPAPRPDRPRPTGTPARPGLRPTGPAPTGSPDDRVLTPSRHPRTVT